MIGTKLNFNSKLGQNPGFIYRQLTRSLGPSWLG